MDGRRTLGGSIQVLEKMTRLQSVFLDSNGFTGAIPDLGRLTELRHLNLSDNRLTGLVPATLMNLKWLEVVSLSNNYLQGPTPKFSANVVADMVGGTNSFCLAETRMKCDARVDFLIRFLEPFGCPLWFAQNWRGNDPCSSWPGITCSDGNITMISLHGKVLAGTISPIIASLTTENTLERHLFHWKEEGLNPLSWKQRLCIALEVAEGMEYLHHGLDYSFIHRNLNPSSILLADNFTARITDFELVCCRRRITWRRGSVEQLATLSQIWK